MYPIVAERDGAELMSIPMYNKTQNHRGRREKEGPLERIQGQGVI